MPHVLVRNKDGCYYTELDHGDCSTQDLNRARVFSRPVDAMRRGWDKDTFAYGNTLRWKKDRPLFKDLVHTEEVIIQLKKGE